MKNRLMSDKSFRRPLKFRLSLNYMLFISRVNNEVIKYLTKMENNKKLNNQEFLLITKDIFENPEFNRLKEMDHHGTTIYIHALRVAYLSYKIARRMKLDYISIARGALLHDFFLYNRKIKSQRPYERGMHGFKHPHAALDNALKHFNINHVEYDIILKHMWPLTMTPPRYKESYIVSFIDKVVASREFIRKFYLHAVMTTEFDRKNSTGEGAVKRTKFPQVK